MVTGPGRPLRVAVLARVIYPWHGYGGLQRHVYDLVRCLLERGSEVTLITQPPTRNRAADPRADATFRHSYLTIRLVPYRTFPLAGRRGTTVLDRSTAYPVFGWRAGRLAADLVARGGVDIVHGHGASALGYALVRRKTGRRRAPFVFNPHGMEEFGATDPSRARLKRLGYWPLQRAVLACAHAADRVIATDRVLVAPVLEHLKVPRASVVVIPNAIELSDYDPPGSPARIAALRHQVGLQPDDVLLLSVGRLEANKGFHVLVQALAALIADGTLPGAGWRWVLVGDGPMRARLEHDFAAAGLERYVHLRGRAAGDELVDWYRAATLFVHPTLYEGSSLVTLEAMACGRAVVATTAGGLPDKVTPGVNGWLVSPGDPAALADALREALADRARLAAMGAESRAIVERSFSWDGVTDQVIALYRDLLAARSSGAA
jgi:glycosyltransferase involved in cell wall biosynthesis